MAPSTQKLALVVTLGLSAGFPLQTLASIIFDVSIASNGHPGFEPEHVSAVAGDSLNFVLGPGVTVRQSTFSRPCIPFVDRNNADLSSPDDTPGFQIVHLPSTYDGRPLWFSSTTGCEQGEVFAINTSPSESYDTFRANALRAAGPEPGHPTPAPSNSTDTHPAPIATAPPSHGPPILGGTVTRTKNPDGEGGDSTVEHKLPWTRSHPPPLEPTAPPGEPHDPPDPSPSNPPPTNPLVVTVSDLYTHPLPSVTAIHTPPGLGDISGDRPGSQNPAENREDGDGGGSNDPTERGADGGVEITGGSRGGTILSQGILPKGRPTATRTVVVLPGTTILETQYETPSPSDSLQRDNGAEAQSLFSAWSTWIGMLIGLLVAHL